MSTASTSRRVDLLIRIVVVCTLACIALAWRLWVARPHYPLVPLWGVLPECPPPWDAMMLLGLVACLVASAIAPQRRGYRLAVVLWLAILLAQDQSRWWPSFYQFFLVLVFSLAFHRDASRDVVQLVVARMQFVLAAIYFWSGVQKLNWYFCHELFPWFVEPISRWTGLDGQQLAWWGLASAVAEASIGVGVLTMRFRRWALMEAMLMHLLIAVCIGPLRGNWNNSAWLWNLAFAAQAGVVFYGTPVLSWRAMFDGPWRQQAGSALLLVLVGILPLLNNFNRWDSALSFNIYSGNVHYAEIRLDAAAVDDLPVSVQAHVVVEQDRAVLNLNRWSGALFHANVYPERRIFAAMHRQVVDWVPHGHAELWILEKATWWQPKKLVIVR